MELIKLLTEQMGITQDQAKEGLGLLFRLTKDKSRWGVYTTLTESIKKAFDANGISTPYPQRDVHIYKHGEKG